MINQSKKPRLFHGSQNKNIEIFEPRRRGFRDSEEGPVIFATPDPAYASCFLVRTPNNKGKVSRWSIKEDHFGPWVKLIADREDFIKIDKGGKLYELPNDTFEFDQEKGTGFYDWISETPVKPLKDSKEYESGVDAMIENQVQVFFVDFETIKKMYERDDSGYSIVVDLQKKGLSENQKRRRNIILVENF